MTVLLFFSAAIEKGALLKDHVRPVESRLRVLNKLADTLANQSMDNDMELDWQSCKRCSWTNRNLLILSDGVFQE